MHPRPRSTLRRWWIRGPDFSALIKLEVFPSHTSPLTHPLKRVRALDLLLFARAGARCCSEFESALLPDTSRFQRQVRGRPRDQSQS